MARVLVNAAGPWVKRVMERTSPRVPSPPIELVQGTHVVVRDTPSRGIYYVESPRDGRAIFVMPWHGNMLVGTTESRFRGDPDAVHPLRPRSTISSASCATISRATHGYRCAISSILSRACVCCQPAQVTPSIVHAKRCWSAIDRIIRACSASTAASSPDTARPLSTSWDESAVHSRSYECALIPGR